MVKQIKMKKIIIAVALLMVGCSKEEIKPCDCLRITDIKHDSIVMYKNNIYTAEITTISNCTFLKTKRMFSSEIEPYKQNKVGECWQPPF
jgi:hypothetical protein